MNLRFNYINEIFYIIKDDRKRFPWLVFLFLFSSLIDLAGLGIIGPYIAIIIDPDKTSQGYAGIFFDSLQSFQEVNDRLAFMSIMLILIFLLKALSAIYLNKVIMSFCKNTQIGLQSYLMHSYQSLSYSEFVERNSSEYINTMTTIVRQFIGSVLMPFLQIVSNSIVIFAIILFLTFVIGPVLLIVVLFFGLLIFVYDRVLGKRLKLYGEKLNTGSEKMLKGIKEGIDGFKELRVLNKQNYFHRIVKSGGKEYANNQMLVNLITIAPPYLFEFLIIASISIFVLLSQRFGLDLKQIAPVFAIFGIAVLRLKPSVSLLATGISNIRYGRYASSKLYSDLKSLENKNHFNNKYKINNKIKNFTEISFNSIKFRYSKSKDWSINDVSFSIKAGESIGFIGPSGAGKTTIMDLILGLLSPQSGEILIDGNPLKEYLSNWHSQVAYLPQEVFLIDDSLQNNVALGIESSRINDSILDKSLSKAQLSDLVAQLPDGVNTFIGERGIRLSGGQRQRIALARAFYHGRDVLVMDEATSALDKETENDIINEIKRLKGQKTLIIIAHRLTTVRYCDRIYSLDKGRIVGINSFEEIADKAIS